MSVIKLHDLDGNAIVTINDGEMVRSKSLAELALMVGYVARETTSLETDEIDSLYIAEALLNFFSTRVKTFDGARIEIGEEIILPAES